MKRIPATPATLLFVLLSLIVANNSSAVAQMNGGAETPQPPMPTKKPKVTKIHDYTMTDDFFWLREKSNPDVIKHLEAENAYADTLMGPRKALQEKLYQEMVSHIKETDDTVPYRWGDYLYFSRTEKGKQYPIYLRKKGSLDAKEEVLLDLNELSKGFKFYSVQSFVPSDDGNLLAYSTDTTGYRQFKLQIKDLRTGQLLPDTFERVGYVAWAPDNKTIFTSGRWATNSFQFAWPGSATGAVTTRKFLAPLLVRI